MREIKFRIWDKLNKKMNTNITRLQLPHDESIERLYGTVLMQFTGLLDKNGKEIYESDIIEIWPAETVSSLDGKYSTKSPGRYAEVRWQSDDARFLPLALTSFEVVGNIYEHPELLK